MRCGYYLFIFGCFEVISSVAPLQPVRFQAGLTVQSSPFDAGMKTLDEWFQCDQGIKALLGAAESVEKGSEDDVYRIVTAGPAFPGLSVRSENSIRINRLAGPALELHLIDATTSATGARPLVEIFKAAQQKLDMKSINKVSAILIDDRYRIESSVTLSLEMQLPSWVPSIRYLETRGSQAFQRMLDKDCGRLVERFRDEYISWADESDCI